MMLVVLRIENYMLLLKPFLSGCITAAISDVVLPIVFVTIY